ncbi:MAG TPA: hypothetical protein VFQ23_00625 [Anaerolineales bacterium]|nr:hypothetical protein [Anaerolineales bacterium]
MNIFKKLLVLILYLFIQACHPSTSKQATVLPISTTPFATKDIQTSQTSTPVYLSSPTPSYSLSPLPFLSEDLNTIGSSNISSLVKLIEFQSQNSYAISIHWSTNSKQIHILRSDGAIEIWDTQKGNLVKVFEPAKKNSNGVGWYPTKNLVAYSDRITNEISVWDLTNNRYLFDLGINTFPFITAQLVTWSADNSKIVSGGWDNTLRVWDASSGDELKVIQSDSPWFESVAWAPSEDLIAVGHKDGLVYVINTSNWKTINTLFGPNSGHEGGAPVVSWSPDGTKIASGGRDEAKAFVWNSSGAQLYQLNNQPLSVFGLGWSADSKMIATSGEGWDVVITDSSTGSELFRIGDHKPNTYCVAWSPDGKLLATSTSEGKIRIWGIRP